MGVHHPLSRLGSSDPNTVRKMSQETGPEWGPVTGFSCCFSLGKKPMLPSGKRLHNYGKLPSLISKSTIINYFYGPWLQVRLNC